MSINTDARFSELPRADIKRSIFNRDSRHLTSFNVGEVVPIYCDEILPGDTFKVKTKKLIRLQTLLTPVLDDMYLDTRWFFVPQRLVFDKSREFWGENTSGAWTQKTEYFLPKLKPPVGGFETGTIADYLGIPVGVELSSPEDYPIALPVRAYAKIIDSFYRDENLQDPLLIPIDEANYTGSNGSDYIQDIAKGGKPFIACKLHDVFTSCLPEPQKGASVDIPLTIGNIPVYALSEDTPSYVKSSTVHYYNPNVVTTPSDYSKALIKGADGKDYAQGFNYNPSDNRERIANLWAASSDFPTGFLNIEDLRLSNAIQEMLELDARGGTRYVEMLKSHFGVTAPDARLQDPEYLGGNRIRINVQEVKNTAQSDVDFLGDVGGYSRTVDSHYDFDHSFVEHGYLLCLACVRYQHTYTQGLERFWSRSNRYDFYDPLFANLGEQPVRKSEIFLEPDSYNHVFGYQEAWYDYRVKPSRASGEMRPGIPKSLASWTFADDYAASPTLSADWIVEDSSNVDRTLAVSSKVANQIFGDFAFKITATRPLPMYSIPGLSSKF